MESSTDCDAEARGRPAELVMDLEDEMGEIAAGCAARSATSASSRLRRHSRILVQANVLSLGTPPVTPNPYWVATAPGEVDWPPPGLWRRYRCTRVGE